jgi:acyl-CoA thioester hydrolase
MNPYLYEFIPQFADTDAAGIVHFSRLLCYVEEAEHRCLFSLGYPIDPCNPEYYQWPRISFTAEFLRPVKAFFPKNITLSVPRLGKSSITWHWEMNDSNHCYARGEMKTVCCKINNSQMDSVPLPASLRQALSA